MNHWAKIVCPSGTIRPAASAVPEVRTRRIRGFRCRVADGRLLPASGRDERNKPSVFNAGLTKLSIPLRPVGTRERKARPSGEAVRPNAPARPFPRSGGQDLGLTRSVKYARPSLLGWGGKPPLGGGRPARRPGGLNTLNRARKPLPLHYFRPDPRNFSGGGKNNLDMADGTW